MDQNNPKLPDEDISLSLTPGKLLVMSIVSANLYLFISLMIIKYLHDGWLVEVFTSEFSIWVQAGIGLGTGCLATGVIYFMIHRDPIAKVLPDYTIFKALSKAELTFFDRAQVSLFAGAGEELLFRGAIQPLIGNTFTSIIFIGIHGYFKFKSPGHILFGMIMFGLSFMLGVLSQHVGLISAMIAHAVYDVIMLQVIQSRNQQ
jgi:membrane protease YdiL (CAAX protease family)